METLIGDGNVAWAVIMLWTFFDSEKYTCKKCQISFDHDCLSTSLEQKMQSRLEMVTILLLLKLYCFWWCFYCQDRVEFVARWKNSFVFAEQNLRWYQSDGGWIVLTCSAVSQQSDTVSPSNAPLRGNHQCKVRTMDQYIGIYWRYVAPNVSPNIPPKTHV